MPWIVIDWDNTKFYGPFFNKEIAENFRLSLAKNGEHTSSHQLEYLNV